MDVGHNHITWFYVDLSNMDYNVINPKQFIVDRFFFFNVVSHCSRMTIIY